MRPPGPEGNSLTVLLSETSDVGLRRPDVRGFPATFGSLGVPAPLAAAGITAPFPIQAVTLPDAGSCAARA